MFVVLKTVQPEKGLIKKIKQRQKIKNSPAFVFKTDKGLPFYVLELLEEKNGIDWTFAAEKCGRYASRIIVSHSLCLPDNSGLKRFIPVSMNAILVFNTALESIKKAQLPADKICITLTDRNAVMSSRVCELLPYASTVRIITTHPERFALAAVDAYENHGASLVIRNAYEPYFCPEIIICCDGAVLSSMNNSAVFTARRKNGGKVRFAGNGTELSEQHKKIIPPDIDTIDFAGALTELCGSPEYKTAVFSDIEISCGKCEDCSAEKCLKCCVDLKL